jgi:hypothetical protein
MSYDCEYFPSFYRRNDEYEEKVLCGPMSFAETWMHAFFGIYCSTAWVWTLFRYALPNDTRCSDQLAAQMVLGLVMIMGLGFGYAFILVLPFTVLGMISSRRFVRPVISAIFSIIFKVNVAQNIKDCAAAALFYFMMVVMLKCAQWTFLVSSPCSS